MTEHKCTPGRVIFNLIPWFYGTVVVPFARKVLEAWKVWLGIIVLGIGAYSCSRLLIWLEQIPPHDDMVGVISVFFDIVNGMLPFMALLLLVLGLTFVAPALVMVIFRRLHVLFVSICNYDPNGSN